MSYNPAKRLNPKYLVIAVIILVSSGVYFNALWNGFVSDDESLVMENPLIKDIRYIPEIFTTNLWAFKGEWGSNYYRPLILVIYMIDYHVFGLKPWGFHLSYILFHAGASALVFLIAFALFDKLPSRHSLNPLAYNLMPAFAASLFFATHPINTEAVDLGGPDPLFTFFYLLSFYLYASSNRERKGRYILSVIFFFISTLCKETALTLPLLLFAYDYSLSSPLPLRERVRGVLDLKKYIPYLTAAVIYFIIRTYAISGFAPFKTHAELSSYEYFINIFPLFAQYLEKLLLPVNLNAWHMFHPVSSILEWKGIVSIILTLLFVFFVYLFGKINRIAFFSLIWIVVPLLPVFYIPALGENTFAERYLYLPSVGFAILSSIGIRKVYHMRIFGQATLPVIIYILILVTVPYSIETIKRNYIWRDSFILWADAVKKSPDGVLPHNNLGLAYDKLGRLQEAIEEYQKAIRLTPDYAPAYNNLGNVYDKLGRLQEAIEEYQKAIRLKPTVALVHYNLGLAYDKFGRLQEAIEEYQKAIRLKPDYAPAYNNLGNVYGKLGRLQEAIEEYQEAIRLSPDLALAYYNLGISYEKKGSTGEAIKELEEALKIKPDFTEARQNLDQLSGKP